MGALSHLVALSLFPLKSGRPFPVTDPRCRISVTPLGLEGDREYMVVDATSGTAVTQRQVPALCKLGLISFSQSLILSFNGEQLNSSKKVDVASVSFPATLHGENVKVLEVGSKFSEWISERIGLKVLLVKKIEKFRRSAGFQDAAPFLLLSQATIDDVAAQTGSEIPRASFRPNLIVDGVEPYGEDQWNRLRIGGQEFAAEPCPRCVVPTIDQSTGIAEPKINKTLARYRVAEYSTPEGPKKGVLIGRYLRPIAPYHSLGIGDPVEVLE